MRREREMFRPRERIRVMQVVNSFHLGGTEGQLVELLRGLPPRYHSAVATLHLAGPHLESVRAMGISPLALDLGASLLSPAAVRQIARLARSIQDAQVELVHAHDFYSTLVAVPAAKLAGARVVVSRVDLSHWLSPAQRLALVAATHAADHVFCNAEAIRQVVLRRERVNPRRVSLVRNGIDLARFDRRRAAAPASRLPRADGKRVIVHVANMAHEVKAQEDLLQALQILLAERPQVSLWLVGDGARRTLLERLAKRLGLGGTVHFLGHRSDVPAILARADIGVLCSRAEGLSNAVIEGMAASLPMVVTDAGGNRELVRDGHRGFVVPVGDFKALSERLKALVDSPGMREKMGRAGRTFVERELTQARFIARHDALYQSVLKARDRPVEKVLGWARKPSSRPAGRPAASPARSQGAPGAKSLAPGLGQPARTE